MTPATLLPLLFLFFAVMLDSSNPQLQPAPVAAPNLQRSLGLMADSLPKQRHTVKILFYGQSITAQAWWKSVADHLHRTFPDANLVIENRAIPGHASPLLVKTAEADLYPFYPDLLIFHVYGDSEAYEQIVRRIRERTTADILIQTDHLRADASLDEETDPAHLTRGQWTPWFNAVFLPDIAEKYGVQLARQRDLWKAHLRANDLAPGDLLNDEVHLNERGERLMAEIVESYLHPPATPTPPDSADDRVTTVAVGPEDWVDGQMTLEFSGNRVDAILAPAGDPTNVGVLIDGRSPADFPDAYRFTRATPYPGSTWPCLLRVQRGSVPVIPETWTFTVTGASEDCREFNFTVRGSVTGPDGEGIAGEKFIAPSGRIVIEPEDWNLAFCREGLDLPLPGEMEIEVEVLPTFETDFTASPAPSGPTESTVTLFQGIPNSAHRLTLRAAQAPPIAALRIYKPPLPFKP